MRQVGAVFVGIVHSNVQSGLDTSNVSGPGPVSNTICNTFKMRLFGYLIEVIGALGEIRTPGPRNRNPMLYPAELRARAWLDYQTWSDRASSGG